MPGKASIWCYFTMRVNRGEAKFEGLPMVNDYGFGDEKPTYRYQCGVGDCLGDLATDNTVKLLADVRNAVGNWRYLSSAAGEQMAFRLPW